ncbi:MAG: hypothetical protein KC777_01145 [Cyanobacteria bacterium HKST-UBA02]|nr:hypothetical protein [Cyanobacteria bacterium HKST-UBA02]
MSRNKTRSSKRNRRLEDLKESRAVGQDEMQKVNAGYAGGNVGKGGFFFGNGGNGGNGGGGNGGNGGSGFRK